jgi:hypothetical protein
VALVEEVLVVCGVVALMKEDNIRADEAMVSDSDCAEACYNWTWYDAKLFFNDMSAASREELGVISCESIRLVGVDSWRY